MTLISHLASARLQVTCLLHELMMKDDVIAPVVRHVDASPVGR